MDRRSLLQALMRLRSACVLLPLACAPAWAAADVPPAEPSEVVLGSAGGVVTADAQAVLDRMTATLKGMDRYAVTASISRDELLPYGYKLQNNEAARMWVDAPGRLRLEVEGDIKNRTYVYDGSTLTMYVPDLNVYSVSPAPATLGNLVSSLLDAGVEMPLIDLLYQGTNGDLTSAVKVGVVVGDSDVGGTPTDHLAFRQADVDWQLWVEKGARALPRRLLITTRYAVGEPQYEALLEWDLKPRLGASTFAFKAPAGAREIPMKTPFAAEEGGP